MPRADRLTGGRQRDVDRLGHQTAASRSARSSASRSSYGGLHERAGLVDALSGVGPLLLGSLASAWRASATGERSPR